MVKNTSKKSNTVSVRYTEIPRWKQWCYGSLLALFVSVYFGTVFAHAFAGLGFSYNPLELIRYTVQIRFPWIYFIVFFAVFEVLVTAMMFMRKKPGKKDELRDFAYANSDDYGTAKLMTHEEAKHCDSLTVDDVYDTIGNILGMFDEQGEETVAFNVGNKRVNRHMLVFGTSNSGKTFSFVKPLLAQFCLRRESVVMSDPKGELFEETSEYFRSFGYVVKCINFKDIAYSDYWNLMSELGPRDDAAGSQERARLFANTVVSNAMPNTSGLFRDGPLSLLMAVLLRVHLDPTLPDSIDEVIRIISNPAGKDYLDQIFDENVLQGDLKCCLGYYSVFKSGSANLSGNILSGLATALNPFQIERVRMVMSHDGIDLTLPGKKPCAYYFLFPDQNEDYKFLIALLFTFVFNDLVAYADAQPNRKCEVPVNILLEEAKSVGVVPLFATRLSNIRSRAIYITTIFQDLAQIQYLYPEDWQSILDNSSTHIGLGFNDQDTAKLFSDRSGAATIVAATEKHQGVESQWAGMFAPTSEGSGNRTVYNPDELMRLGRDECVVALQGQNLLQVHKFPITLHPDFELMDAKHVKPMDVIPNVADEEGRAEYYAKCDQQVAEYEAWLAAGNKPIHGKRDDREDEDEGSLMDDAFKRLREAINRANEVVLDRETANARRKNRRRGHPDTIYEDFPQLTTGYGKYATGQPEQENSTPDSNGDDEDDFAAMFDDDVSSWFTNDNEDDFPQFNDCDPKPEPAPESEPEPEKKKEEPPAREKTKQSNVQHDSGKSTASSINTQGAKKPERDNKQDTPKTTRMSAPKLDKKPAKKGGNTSNKQKRAASQTPLNYDEDSDY